MMIDDAFAWRNYYAALGVHRASTMDERRDAYQRLVSATHPDRTPSTALHRRFIAAAQAYRVLRSARNEQAYLTQLRALGRECNACTGTGTRAKTQGWHAVNLIACSTCHGCGYLPRAEQRA